MAGETKILKGASGTQTPQEEDGLTPDETPTLTKKEAEALVAKATHNTLTDYKRLETEFNRSQSVAQAAISRLKVMEDQQLRAEEESVKDDPERLSALRLKREAVRLKQEAEEEMQKVETGRAEVKTQYQEILTSHAERLSEKYNVKPEYLLKYGGTSKGSMEELAQTYGERTAELPGETKTNQPKKVVTYSGQTKGGSAGLTMADVAKMSVAERRDRSAEIAKIPFA